MKPYNSFSFKSSDNEDRLAYQTAFDALCKQVTDVVEPLYLQALEVAKLHKTLNKTALELIDFRAGPRPLVEFKHEYSCSRIDILVDTDLRKCLDQACTTFRHKYRRHVYYPGWAEPIDDDST